MKLLPEIQPILSACVTFVTCALALGAAEPSPTELAGPRQTWNFNPGWKLYVGEPAGAERSDFDDAAWRPVTLPHA